LPVEILVDDVVKAAEILREVVLGIDV